MRHAVLALFLGVASGCGVDSDPRPLELEVLALEVMGPSCGDAHCHNSSTRPGGLAFDSVSATRTSLTAKLDEVLEVIDDQSMPPASPIDSQDLAFLRAWVAAGKPGL